ncbi:MAG: NUDIX hydrolase [Candidatus Levybacteria bacterium]|nr:NUDIX hydrolase [Candidatus Levybacteria bacterium]
MERGIDYIGVGIVFYCHDGKGNFIMSKRSKNTRDEHGRWDPGGGGIELGETIDSALTREIKEEYCTDVKSFEFLGFRDVHRINEKGEKTHWMVFDFKVLVDRKKVKNGVPDEHEKIGWFRLDNLPEPAHSQFPFFLKKYKTKLLK